jgi:transcriptional regulator with GAF, ATPase, and Fis domain
MKQEELSILLSIIESIPKVNNMMELFKLIFEKLHNQYFFKLGGAIIYNKKKTHLEFFLKGINNNESFESPFDFYEKLPFEASPIKISLSQPAIQRIDAKEIINNPGFENLKAFSALLERELITELLAIPLQIARDVIGVLILAYRKDNILKEEELTFFQQFSNQIAILISASVTYNELADREHIKDFLLELTNSLFDVKDRDDLFIRIFTGINKLLSLNYVCISLKNFAQNEQLTVCLTKGKDGVFVNRPAKENFDIPFLALKSRLNTQDEETIHEFANNEFESLCRQSAYFRNLKETMDINCALYTNYTLYDVGEINFIIAKDERFRKYPFEKFSTSKRFQENEIEFLIMALPQIKLIIMNYFAFEEILSLRKKLEEEKNYLLDEINLENNFHEIIGNSIEIQNVLTKVQQVAPLQVNVLIQGETGTGKELIARAIHTLSDRKERTLVKINCAALPANLIESELFGHEKGSFTGAVEKRIGKFELANGSAIFLDEIGELPLELQAKLLRVLQEQEIERIGGKEIIKIDVRVISATNRNLEAEVEKGNFRKDLFYRLNVFPINLPPLRKRGSDIPLFVKFFLEKYSKKIGKPVKAIKKSDLDILLQYDWPGNIRELEHLIEKAVIVSDGPNLEFGDFMFVKSISGKIENMHFRPLAEMERDYIIAALKSVNGRVSGENGAARLLNVNSKTLSSKMAKLNIKREIFFS